MNEGELTCELRAFNSHKASGCALAKGRPVAVPSRSFTALPVAGTVQLCPTVININRGYRQRTMTVALIPADIRATIASFTVQSAAFQLAFASHDWLVRMFICFHTRLYSI